MNELEHSKYLSENNPEKIWHWDSSTGIIRWDRRVKMFLELLRGRKNILELGCGTGLLTRELKGKIVAIDICHELISIAKSRYSKAKYIVGDANEMSFYNEFDAVVGSSSLHHLNKDVLENIYHALKPGGIIVFTEPNMLNPHIFLERKIKFLRKKFGVSEDETAFVRWNLKRELKKQGFTNIQIVPFDFLYPYIPNSWVGFVTSLGLVLERIPVIKEFSGSLLITAKKD